jgi:SAM-dependent methyltransferase
MTDPLIDTVDYYDRCAADFAAQTADLDLEPLYQHFLRYVPLGGRILDAGCGVGRDALAFAEHGYEVVAFDASEAMVQLARQRVGDRAVVYLMRFQDLHWQNEFDGIWACFTAACPETMFHERRPAADHSTATEGRLVYVIQAGSRGARGRETTICRPYAGDAS